MIKSWKQYEKQVFDEFRKKYPQQTIDFNQFVRGRHSKVGRQIDILIRVTIADSVQLGVFDCKKFNKKVDVKAIDEMVGYMDDLNVSYGGIITCIGFTKAAINRANASNIKLDVVEFKSPEELVKHFIPSLDFSDSRNSQYIPLLFH